MPPAEPPRRGKLPSVTDLVVPGAVHELRDRPATDTVPTVPPPAPDRRPFPRASVAGIRVPSVAKPPPLPVVESFEKTIAGPLPVLTAHEPEDEDGDRKSTHEAIQSADTLADLLAAKNAELARVRAEFEAAKRVPVSASIAPSEKQLRKAAMHSAVLKVLVALAGALGAVTTYLAVHSATVLPPRVENTEARTKVVEVANSADHELLLGVMAYLRAEQDRRECIESQIASAIVRGTGHRISGPADANWIESSMPSRKPSLTWDRAVWYPASPCANEPKVP